MLVHGEQAVALAREMPGRGRDRGGHRDRRHLRQGLGRRWSSPRRPPPWSATASRCSPPASGAVHPGRGRLGRRPGPVVVASRSPDRDARPRGHLPDPHRPGADSTGCRATATRCTPTPSSRRWPGFDRPILHGLCTYGFTGRALLHALCGGDPARFRSMTRPLLQPGVPGRGADGADVGRGRRRGRVPDRRRPTAASSSTPAGSPSTPPECRASLRQATGPQRQNSRRSSGSMPRSAS